MIKQEPTTQHVTAPLAFKKPRGIQFTVNERSSYEYAMEYAAFSNALAAVSEIAEDVGGVTFEIRYSAKMNHEQIGDFVTECENLRRRYCWSCIDERDGRNWDSNIQVRHRVALCEVYDLLSSDLGKHARSGIEIRSVHRSKSGGNVQYTVCGTVKSGHPDTSSGNSALNREISMQAISNLPPHLRPRHVRGLVMGDDYIAWLYFDHPVDPVALATALSNNEQALGIDPKRGIFDDVRCASFISLGFYRSIVGTIIALPKPGRLLSRLFWTSTALQGRDPKRLAAGIAEAFMPLYNTCPFMRDFLAAHLDVPALGGRELCPGYLWSEMGLQRLPEPIDWAENHLVKYGADAALLDLRELRHIGRALCHHPVVTHMYAIDTSDPDERRGCVSRSM